MGKEGKKEKKSLTFSASLQGDPALSRAMQTSITASSAEWPSRVGGNSAKVNNALRKGMEESEKERRGKKERKKKKGKGRGKRWGGRQLICRCICFLYAHLLRQVKRKKIK